MVWMSTLSWWRSVNQEKRPERWRTWRRATNAGLPRLLKSNSMHDAWNAAVRWKASGRPIALGRRRAGGPGQRLLRSFGRISQDVEAALRQESSYNQRLALRAVEDDLDGLLRELTRSSDATRCVSPHRHAVARRGGPPRSGVGGSGRAAPGD